MLSTIAALICIVVGILIAVLEGKFLFPPLEWFVLAIAFNTLSEPSDWWKRGRTQ